VRVLIVTAVPAEARAIGRPADARVVVAGIGRTNAAAATTEAIVRAAESAASTYDCVISAGVAGALPGGDLAVGNVIVASACVYAEEGLVTAHGHVGIEAMGFGLGDFPGNAVPVDPALLEILGATFSIGAIATVATCSGTDAAAAEIARRTGARAEAMEGAAVVHAARRLRVPAIELRAISNRAGARSRQEWDLPRALEALGAAVDNAIALLRV
jgi:futalosine hydrolase